MKIDTEHLHFWMQAIRQSENPIRTMDAFWSGQIKSKEWLISNLLPFAKDKVTIDIHGGWVGVLASLIFQSDISVASIRSIDIDETCSAIASTMNAKELMEGRFEAVHADMVDIKSLADVIINTSCEHISQQQYDKWLNGTKPNSVLVLQSNNFNIPEHVRLASSLEEFKHQCKISNVLWSGELVLPLYTRYMVIGTK